MCECVCVNMDCIKAIYGKAALNRVNENGVFASQLYDCQLAVTWREGGQSRTFIADFQFRTHHHVWPNIVTDWSPCLQKNAWTDRDAQCQFLA